MISENKVDWTTEDVELLGRNMTRLTSEGLGCADKPSEQDLVAFRTAPERLTALMKWLSLGERGDAEVLNAFKHVQEAFEASGVEDMATAHTVKIDWEKRKLTLQKESEFDEYVLRTKQADDFATVWMAFEQRRGDPSDQVTALWIADWRSRKMYRKASTAGEAGQGGDLGKVAGFIAELGGVEQAFDWARARRIYDEAFSASPFAFNPLA